MNLRDLEYVAAIADHGSLARAAEACHVSASTLSIQLAKLEAYLGVILFERTSRRVEPTVSGRAIITLARDIVHRSQNLRDVARQAQHPFGGMFKLGAFPTLAPYYLPKIVPLIGKALPHIKLRLIEEKSPVLLEKLRKHELDAALLSLPVDDKELVAAPLFEDPFYLACPSSANLASRKTMRVTDLADETLMLLEDGHCLRDQALDICHSSKAREDQEFRATSLETLRQMVASGAGMTLMPQIACLPTQHVRYIPFTKQESLNRSIGLVWRKSTTRSELMNRLATVLAKYKP